MDGIRTALETFRAVLRPCAAPLLLSILTIATGAKAQQSSPDELARKAPPRAAADSSSSLPFLPRATPLDTNENGTPLTIEADTEEEHGDIYTLSGNVVITIRDRTVNADRITYDKATGRMTADGHVRVTGGENAEFIEASRAEYNLNTELGRFYDVHGSVGFHATGAASAKSMRYQNANPFLFSGRVVVKNGENHYDIYDGKVTSCLLPNPDWQLSSKHFSLDGEKARAYNSTFRLLHTPIFFLPYVTHPLDAEQRQSGLLIPSVNFFSNTNGTVVLEEAYFALGRSADMTVGLKYLSKRGYGENGTFRYRGVGNDFMTAHFSALQDRGYIDPHTLLYVNQGGQDVTLAFRRKLTPKTRVVGDAEYLSDYVYREAFTESFNQAVSSDITSILYAVNQQHGYSTAFRADRYQGLKRVPFGNLAGQQVRIFHAPSVDFTAVDHPISGTPFLWSLDASAAGLKRSQPNFVSSGIVERLDFRPELSLPLIGGGWHTLSSVAVRETFTSRSRQVPYPTGVAPIELTAPSNRASAEVQVDIRPPAIERDFVTPKLFAGLLGPRIRHVVEPEVVYRRTAGIGNGFLSLLRFDDVDVDSNTNELQYGVTQRLFASRAKPQKPTTPCADEIPPASELQQDPVSDDPPSGLDANGIPVPDSAPEPVRTHHKAESTCAAAEPRQEEWLSWRVAQVHYFDPNFGGAVINGRRNIFDTTLNFSGVAFLTEGRDTSPLISRFRMRTSSHSDVEWDFDLDTGAKKFLSSNVFVEAHEGPVFGAISYARLNAPGRFYTETIDTNNIASLTSSAVSDFQQMRVLMGFGTPTRPGLSAAANAGIDINSGGLQYASAQTSYNWNCCGVSVEYRKYQLGSVRNEGTYRFNFTLANIGTAGNLRRSERLF